jgi:hypothetical protein
MSDRHTQQLKTNAVQPVQYNFILIGAGAAAPTIGEGVISGVDIVSPIIRNSQGNYSFTINDKFLAVQGVHADYLAATVTTSWGITFGLPSQNATTFLWTFNMVVYVTNSGTATDIILNDKVAVSLTFRNSLVLP